MPVWKVLLILVFGVACLALATATLCVPISLEDGQYRWVWFGGLLVATVCMGTLFKLFLDRADRILARDWKRGRR
jgi:hypothetical protein